MSEDRYAITQWESTSAEPSLLSKYRSLQAINAELVEALEDVSEHLADILHGLCSWESHEVDDRLSVTRDVLTRARGGGDEKPDAMTFEDAIHLARGCFDFGGGYRSQEERDIFHHGIQTVVNVLEDARENGTDNFRMKVLRSMGKTDYNAR